VSSYNLPHLLHSSYTIETAEIGTDQLEVNSTVNAVSGVDCGDKFSSERSRTESYLRVGVLGEKSRRHIFTTAASAE